MSLEERTQSASSGRYFVNGFVMPSQLPSRGQRKLWEGERRLLTAILEEAIESFCSSSRRRKEREEAAIWLFSDDWSWCFSFRNICNALDLDAAAIRKAVLKRTKMRCSLPMEIPSSAQ